ncbi:MAG: shikimate kinase [Thermoleophilia bacterium]|nr:shikimate kinase [Actinomycetota bacterium]
MAPLVALSGFMGSGKSSVGRLAARELGWRFVDLDQEIETRAGRSIPAIFAEEGEAGFRRIEEEILAQVVASIPGDEGVVLALGGGTVTTPRAVEMLRSRGRIVYLEVPVREAWARVESSDRPLARSRKHFETLARERRSVYLRTADVVVDTAGLTAAQVAERVARVAEEGT